MSTISNGKLIPFRAPEPNEPSLRKYLLEVYATKWANACISVAHDDLERAKVVLSEKLYPMRQEYAAELDAYREAHRYWVKHGTPGERAPAKPRRPRNLVIGRLAEDLLEAHAAKFRASE